MLGVVVVVDRPRIIGGRTRRVRVDNHDLAVREHAEKGAVTLGACELGEQRRRGCPTKLEAGCYFREGLQVGGPIRGSHRSVHELLREPAEAGPLVIYKPVHTAVVVLHPRLVDEHLRGREPLGGVDGDDRIGVEVLRKSCPHPRHEEEAPDRVSQ